MKRLFGTCLIISLFSGNLVAQNSYDVSDTGVAATAKSNFRHRINYDSIWSFEPVYIMVNMGIWSPVGLLGHYYNTSPKIGLSIGVNISEKLTLALGANLIPHNNRQELDVGSFSLVKKTISTYGFDVEGFLSYPIYKDKLFFIKCLSGLTFANINTDIEDPSTPSNKKGDILTATTLGINLGADIFVNKFGNKNIGVRVLYTFAPYNLDKILKTNIGGHSFSALLFYSFPKRQ